MSVSPEFDAFICYSRKTGATLAQLFRAALVNAGVRVFLDVEVDYYGPFPQELRSRITHTPFFIVLLTKDCLESKWVQQEIAHAFGSQRQIVVVRDATFVMPEVSTLTPRLAELMDLNQIPYLHEFSDEVVTRVIARLRPRRAWFSGRARLWSALSVGVVIAAGLVGRDQLAALLGVVASSTAEETPSPPDSQLASSTPTPTPTPGLPEVKAPERTPHAVDSRSPATDPEQPTPRPASSGAVHAAAVAEQHAAEDPKKSWCYHPHGYSPLAGKETSGCKQFASLEACRAERGHDETQSVWTEATECESCACPP